MIKSEIGRGLVYGGDTPYTSTIAVVQSGPMQLTVKAGQLTDGGGTVHVLGSDAVFNLVPDATYPMVIQVLLVQDSTGAVGTLLQTRRIGADPDFAALPTGDTLIDRIILDRLESQIPAGATSIDSVDFYVLTSAAGLPPAA